MKHSHLITLRNNLRNTFTFIWWRIDQSAKFENKLLSTNLDACHCKNVKVSHKLLRTVNKYHAPGKGGVFVLYYQLSQSIILFDQMRFIDWLNTFVWIRFFIGLSDLLIGWSTPHRENKKVSHDWLHTVSNKLPFLT